MPINFDVGVQAPVLVGADRDAAIEARYRLTRGGSSA